MLIYTIEVYNPQLDPDQHKSMNGFRSEGRDIARINVDDVIAVIYTSQFEESAMRLPFEG